MKQRFNFLDLRAVVNELHPKITNKFVQNFYSTQQRIIYVKFSSKDILLIEPGIRMHLTSNADEGISHFCNILRKKARRDKVVNIYQVGFDRVIVIELTRQKIVVEFFSGGNIFILDENDKILEVFRVVKELDIVKNTQYLFNPVEFNFGWESFCKLDLSEFLPFEEEIVNNLLEKINKQTNTEIIKEKKIEHKEIFEKCMSEFLEYIKNIKGVGIIELKKNNFYSFYPFDIKNNNKKVFSSFNEAVEEFFSGRKKTAKKIVDKSEKVKNKQNEHIKELENMIADLDMKSNIMNNNKSIIDEICKIHTSVIKNKMKWEDFTKYKEDEKNKGNELATKIIDSDFKNKKCIINLKNEEEDCFINLDFEKSLHLNIQDIFEKKKKLQEKIKKTKIAIDTVKIKNIKKEEKIKIQRTIFWFEKFNFCFTTNKKLVIGGKNVQQNEILVKKHLLPNQLYFHTESSGGSSVISDEDAIIEEVAEVALCNSSCWAENIISSVFYVKGNQVSKTPPTGQYLAKGSFLIKGTKSYLSPHKLEYGVALLFKTTDEVKEDDYFIKFEEAIFVTDPSDYEIEYALPLAAPYKILKTLYKFKARILPGKDKKGKVVQNIISSFIKKADERIIKVIKRISVEEFMNVLPTNCKMGKELK